MHYSKQSLGLPLSAQRLSHWLCEAVAQAYLSSGVDPPESIRAHSTRGISSSTALHEGMTVEDICTAASWSFPCSFIRFYLQDVSSFSMTHSVPSVLSVMDVGWFCCALSLLHGEPPVSPTLFLVRLLQCVTFVSTSSQQWALLSPALIPS